MNKPALLEKTIGYSFKDEALFIRALTHRSARGKNNERLEFLGDAVLNFVSADALFHEFPQASEGQLTRLRSRLVKEAALAELAQQFNLKDYIILGPGEKKSGGFRRDSILADAVEAIIGAIYCDSDFETAATVLRLWLMPKIAVLNLDEAKDPKTQLQEWLQSMQRELPEYTVENIEGKPHDQEFTVKCVIDVEPEGVFAKGSSRRIAEQQAAAKMLEKVK